MLHEKGYLVVDTREGFLNLKPGTKTVAINPVLDGSKAASMMGEKAGLAWTSYAHTGVPVPVSAMGAGAESFNGYYDNTDIFTKMVALMNL